MYKRFIKDSIMSILGEGMLLMVLQFFVYPIILKSSGETIYGIAQTSISIMFVISGTFGISLETLRLIYENKLSEDIIEGNIKKIYSYTILIISIVSLIVSKYYFGNNLHITFLFICTCMVHFTTFYFSCYFKIKFEFYILLKEKIIGCLGYFLGLLLFYCFDIEWYLIIIISYLCRCIYMYSKVNINLHLFNDSIDKNMLIDYAKLNGSNLIDKSLTYIDKILIFPILGAKYVSVYYVSSIFSKIILEITQPTTNVLLSYLSNRNVVKKEEVFKNLAVGLLVVLCFCMISYIANPLIIKLIYPSMYIKAKDYFLISIISSCIISFGYIIKTYTLRIFNSKYQVSINAFSLIIYIAIFVLLNNNIGLYRYFICSIVSQSIKNLYMLLMLMLKYEK